MWRGIVNSPWDPSTNKPLGWFQTLGVVPHRLDPWPSDLLLIVLSLTNIASIGDTRAFCANLALCQVSSPSTRQKVFGSACYSCVDILLYCISDPDLESQKVQGEDVYKWAMMAPLLSLTCVLPFSVFNLIKLFDGSRFRLLVVRVVQVKWAKSTCIFGSFVRSSIETLRIES